LARGAKHLNTQAIIRIITSWLVTIPIGAILTILYWVLLRIIFGV
jgi:PiT family inorganic phosphate transporter